MWELYAYKNFTRLTDLILLLILPFIYVMERKACSSYLFEQRLINKQIGRIDDQHHGVLRNSGIINRVHTVKSPILPGGTILFVKIYCGHYLRAGTISML